jgi:hypothetical protein
MQDMDIEAAPDDAVFKNSLLQAQRKEQRRVTFTIEESLTCSDVPEQSSQQHRRRKRFRRRETENLNSSEELSVVSSSI